MGRGATREPGRPFGPVHPHERGERWGVGGGGGERNGSSPRAWGEARLVHIVECGARFIPTSVGRGGRICAWVSEWAVHPHERGERHDAQRLRILNGGSSPRAWGEAPDNVVTSETLRFIPTSVGRGSTSHSASAFLSVHPHERGERQRQPLGQRFLIGSSPRAWGEGRYRAGYGIWLRFIPTSVGRGRWLPPQAAPRPVHPHERGERLCKESGLIPMLGSSPRAWGEVYLLIQIVAYRRFIPTSVGRGCTRYTRWAVVTVHPHERGERNLRTEGQTFADGSSPRAWGEVPAPFTAVKPRRFIPTSVGRGTRCASPILVASVHPHERGERDGGSSGARAANGSSPRAWGEARGRKGVLRTGRFIPTSVGRGVSLGAVHCSVPVHPHERGERFWWGIYTGVAAGSSPRAWGEGFRIGGIGTGSRFIPTSVGRGLTGLQYSGSEPVHPHERGERAAKSRSFSGSLGSSPRAWGEGQRVARRYAVYRFIPTSVGRGRAVDFYPYAVTVHPHERGERLSANAMIYHHSGSSPRAWGEGSRMPTRLRATRFIPTSVGRGLEIYPKIELFSL